MSVGHPRGTHSRYVIGCCVIPLGICGLKNNSRRITYGIGCVWGMPSLSPLSSLGYFELMDLFKRHCLTDPTMVSVSPTSFIIVGRSMLDLFCGVSI